MKLYGGIDLHSNNSLVALFDEEEQLVYRRRQANDAAGILQALAPYREAIVWGQGFPGASQAGRAPREAGLPSLRLRSWGFETRWDLR